MKLGVFSAAFGPGSYSVGSEQLANIWETISGTRAKSGVNVNQESALYNSAVFACQRGISESLAMLPRDIFEKDSRGFPRRSSSFPELERILTREPNPLMTPISFFQTLTHHALGAGNGYAEIQFKPKTGIPIALWPIPPNRVMPKLIINKDDQLDLIYEIRTETGALVTLPRDLMLHIPGLGYNGITGYPVVQYAMNAIGLSQALEDYGSLFFSQGADVSGYVSVPDSATDDQIINMRKHYNALNSGLSNAHRWKFLYESAKFVPTGIKPTDAQMKEIRVLQTEEIARFFRMPLGKIQAGEKKASYASREQENQDYVTDTLMPWAVRWEEEIKRKLFIETRHASKYAKFNFNALLRGDSQSRATFYRTMVFAGIMTRNEARALEDMAPLDGGDEPMVPLNMTGDLSDKERDARERRTDD